MSQLETNSPAVLLKRLCAHLSKTTDDSSLQYQLALKYIGSYTGASINEDEFYYAEKIKKKLIQSHQESEIATFSALHQKLQTYNSLKHQWAILCLFLHLQNAGKQFKFKKLPLPITSTPFTNLQSKFETSRNTTSIGFPSLSTIRNEHITLPRAYQSSLSSGFGSALTESNTTTNINKFNLNWAHARNKDNVKKELSENTLIRELVYCLQGIEGNIFTIEDEKEGFCINSKVHVKKSLRAFALRMAELGWLFNKIKKFYDACNADKTLGLVGQSFVAAINTELTEYYRYLAILEAQLQQEDDPNLSPRPNGLTLSRLQVWTLEPLCRLKMLATLVDVSKGLKGGALASMVYLYLQHGDPLVKGLVENILSTMAAPICTMLLRWIFDGELEDNYHEFFVAANYNVSDEKLWREKYSLRKSMVPSFISMNQAKKILSTGKSINFLRQLCQDTTPLVGRQKLMDTMESTRLKSLFKQDHDSYLQTMIDLAYKETSLRVLDIMQTKYKFMDHLKAMRRYLLLGQGDFIRHLMDLLENDLSKPAASLYLHNLSGILETAVRATNAQFDDPDILKRLDVRLLEVSPGDYGWDVFSLDYHVDGPIGTVFTPSAIMVYLRLFNALWRAKRMEYVLCGVWKSQMSHARLLKDIPELPPVLHQCHILASEMVHFIQQIQYYITFEVMECSWDVLEKKVKSAADLDQIIAAHEEFLDTILARSLLDEDSRILLNQLRTIYDLIIQLQTVHDRLCIQAVQEVDRIRSTRSQVLHNAEMGEWGIDEATVETNAQYYQELVKNVIPSTRAQLRILAQSYQDMVQKFLLMLTSHPDVSLQFLSFRLDFNEHYKNRNSRLRTHLTYQHRRLSSIGLH